MTSNDATNQPEQGSFTAGVILGTLLGGASLFLFGTKTGRKMHQQLQEEFASGNLNFQDLQNKTNQKLEHFLATTNVSEHLKKILHTTRPKPSQSKTAPKPKKNFFQKKGKTLG